MSGQHPVERGRIVADRPPLRGAAARARQARSLWRARRWFADPQRYAAGAALTDEIAARLLARVDCARLAPRVVLDLGAGSGRALDALSRRFPRAALLALDASEAMLAGAPADWRWWRRPLRAAADAQCLPLADASVDLLFSNLMLPWCADLPLALAEMRRVLRPGGALFLSTLGPGCLTALDALGAADARLMRLAWPLPDLRELTDLLAAGGFGDAVGDVERLRVSYARRETLAEDLLALGLAALAARDAWLDVRCGGAARRASPQPLQLPLEVLFVHAWRAPGELPAATGAGGAQPLRQWPKLPGHGLGAGFVDGLGKD